MAKGDSESADEGLECQECAGEHPRTLADAGPSLAQRARRPPGGFPRSRRSVDGGGVQLFPCGPAATITQPLVAVPLHAHANEDETLYVLDGEIVVHIDGENHPLGPRGIAVAPRGVPHAFLVTSPTARVLCLQTPGSAEAFYRGASEPAGADTDPTGPVDFDRVRKSAERSGGMQFLGPPPFDATGPARAEASSVSAT